MFPMTHTSTHSTLNNTIGCDGIFSCAQAYCNLFSQENVSWVAVRTNTLASNCSSLYCHGNTYEYVSGWSLGKGSIVEGYLALAFSMIAFICLCLRPCFRARFSRILSWILYASCILISISLVVSYSLWIAYLYHVYSLLGDAPPSYLSLYVILLNVMVIIYCPVHIILLLFNECRGSKCHDGYHNIN